MKPILLTPFRRTAAALAATSILLTFTLALRAAKKDGPNASGPAVNPDYMDLSVKPGDDFYAYCCGVWEKNTPIPSDRVEVSPGTALYDTHDKNLADLIQAAGTSSPARGSCRLRLLASLDQLAFGVLQLSAELLGILVIRRLHLLSDTADQHLRALILRSFLNLLSDVREMILSAHYVSPREMGLCAPVRP